MKYETMTTEQKIKHLEQCIDNYPAGHSEIQYIQMQINKLKKVVNK